MNTDYLNKIKQFMELRSEINQIPFHQMFKIWITEFISLMHKHKISLKKKAFICHVSNSDPEGINFNIFVDPTYQDENGKKTSYPPQKNTVINQIDNDHIYCDLLMKISANTNLQEHQILSDIENQFPEFEKEVFLLQKNINSIVPFLRQEPILEEYKFQFDEYFLVSLEGDKWANNFIHSILPYSEMKAHQSVQLNSPQYSHIEIDNYYFEGKDILDNSKHYEFKCLVFKFFNRTVFLLNADLSELNKNSFSSEELKIIQLYADRVFIRNESI